MPTDYFTKKAIRKPLKIITKKILWKKLVNTYGEPTTGRYILYLFSRIYPLENSWT